MPPKKSIPTRYIDPLVDFAFKKIFGSEPNKDLLIAFLNEVLRGRRHIANLVYGKNEHSGDNALTGGAVFDLFCTGGGGEQFIIEIQRGSQENFKERALFYTSRLISNQAPKGSRNLWAYNLTEVYFIALLEDFTIVNPAAPGAFLHDIALRDLHTGKVFYEKLHYTYIELRNFVKAASELETDFDKWLYVLKHLSTMKQLPVYLRKPVFKKLFKIAEYTNLSKEEQMRYDSSQKFRWDNYSVKAFALKQAKEQVREQALKEGREEGREEGLEKGLEKGREEGFEKGQAEEKRLTEQKILSIAQAMKADGIPVTQIAKFTGLTVGKIRKL